MKVRADKSLPSPALIEYSTYGNNFDIILRGWSAPSLRAYDKDGKAYEQKGSGKGGFYNRSQIVIEGFDRGEKSIILKAFSYSVMSSFTSHSRGEIMKKKKAKVPQSQ